MKKIVTFLVFLLILTCAVSAFAEYQTVEVYVNGKLLVSDSPAVLVGSRTMVPLRAISEELGCEVGWNPETQTAEIKNSVTAVYVTIDSAVMVKKTLAEDKSENITIDAPAMLYKSRTLIPLRAVSEALDAKVDWDAEKECALITTDTFISHYGIVSETGYISEEAGVEFAAPEGFAMLHNVEEVEKQPFAKDAEAVNATSILEFSGYFMDSGSNVTVAISPETEVSGKEYLEYIRPLVESSSGENAYVSAAGIGEVEIAGVKFDKIVFVTMYKGTRLNLDYCAGKVGNRLVIITITYAEGMEINKDEIIERFKFIEK